MSISNVIAGRLIYRSKINEIILAAGGLSVSWVNFNGTTGAIRDSSPDISSVTRGSFSAYNINFVTPKASINYVVQASCSPCAGNDTGFVQTLILTRACAQIQCRNDDGGSGDPDIVCAMIIGPDPNDITSGVSVLHLTPASIIDTVPGYVNASAKYSLNVNGTAGFDTANSGSGLFAGDWVEDAFEVTLYQVRATLISGTAPTGAPLNTWLNFTTDRYWEIAGLSPFAPSIDCTLKIQIRDSASLAVRVSAQIVLGLQDSV
ncbi:MAG: hypothetical protein V4493_01370 [Pseudomonadota bacterium]